MPQIIVALNSQHRTFEGIIISQSEPTLFREFGKFQRKPQQLTLSSFSIDIS